MSGGILDSRSTRNLLDAPLRVCIDTMLDAFGAYEAIRDEVGRIVDFEIVHVNEHACVDLGVSRDNQIGRRLCELFPEVRTSGRFDIYASVVSTGITTTVDGIPRGNRFFDMRVSRLGDGFVVNWRDVTARKRLELDLQQSNEALRARAEELTVLMDATPATVWIATDPECRQIRGSRLAHELLRTTPGENVTMTPGTDAPPPPNHFTVWQHGRAIAPDDLPVQRAARGEELRNFEEEVVFDDGERIWLYGNAMPLRNPDGTPRGAIAAFVDISQYKRIEQELRIASEAKDQFLATMSHELRTPLTAVLGYLQMLQKGAVASERQPQVIETISRNAALQLQLIDDILDVSGIIRGKLVIDRTPVNLTSVIETAITTLVPTADRKGITITPELDAADSVVLGDQRRLHQVFGNVLANAVKFTPPGGRVCVSLRQSGAEFVATITDTGIGMTREFLPRVFERFSQEDTGSTREHGGLGLGLNLAHYFVTQHAGTITASSDGPGTGATLEIRLPQANAKSSGNTTTTHAAHSA